MRPPDTSDSTPPAAAEPNDVRSGSAAAGNAPLGPGTIALTLLLVALWGGTPVAIKYSVATIPPIAVAAIRFAMAAVLMYVWCRLEGTSISLRKGQLRPCLILGGLLCVQITLFTLGVQLSIASHGTLFINTFIFWVAAIEHFVTRTDRLSPMRLGGLVLAAAGVLLILTMQESDSSGAPAGRNLTAEAEAVLPAQQPEEPTVHSAPPQVAQHATLLGDFLLLASGMLLGVKIICTKQATQVVEPGKLIFWHDVIGTALMAVWSLLTERVDPAGFTLPATLGLLYQGVVVAGFCFGVQARLLRKHSASQLSVYSFATPLFGILLAVIMLGERLSPWLLVSGAAVATGIWLVNRRPRPASEAAA